MFHDENLSFRQINTLTKSDPPPPDMWIKYVALVRGPWTPDRYTAASSGHVWQDSPIRKQFIILLRNNTTVVLITLGFVAFGVWQSEIMAKRGGGQKPQLLFSLYAWVCDLQSLAERDNGKAGWAGRNNSYCSHYAWVCDLRGLAERDNGKAGWAGRNNSYCSHYAWVCDLRGLAERDNGKAGWGGGQKPQLLFSLYAWVCDLRGLAERDNGKAGWGGAETTAAVLIIRLGLWPSGSGRAR